ncbi:MAG: arsenate reductase ArsC [Acidobacteriota bacterium]
MAREIRILFVCTGNSARSQMAEGFARYYGGDYVHTDSAGTDPKGLNPYALWAMNETGIDISHQTSDALSSKRLEDYDYLVTLCGDARDSCPVLPPQVKSEHWPLADPAKVRGKPSEMIASFRIVRFQIEQRVKDFLSRILQKPLPRTA